MTALAIIILESTTMRQPMANISVRNLDERTVTRLRIRAARNGVSMEEEVRRILKQAANVPDRLGELALRLFGPDNGVHLDLPEHEPHEPLVFTE